MNGIRCAIKGERKAKPYMSMSTVKFATAVLLACGFGLHTYTAVVLASAFHPGFWLWSLFPYFVVSLMLWKWKHSFAIFGATALPVLADVAMHFAVFKASQSSTSAIGLMAMPLWNLMLMIPAGSAVGWFVDRRTSRAAQTAHFEGHP